MLVPFVSTAQTVTYPSLPITASEAYLSVYAKGRISIKYINPTNPVLTRPLIVAEGFDPGHITAPEKISGESAITDFVEDVQDNNDLQTLLFDLPQYDVVYVDWGNGTDYLQRNALLLEEVIRWVNSHKVAVGGVVQPNVVLGQSMGGVIARWALRDMEDKGQNHQTRLYISYDAPHQGANVPQGYQHLARHARDLYIKAAPLAGPVETIQFFRGKLSPFRALSLANEPASRQMLVNYVNDLNLIDNSIHNTWQTELKNKGYPQGVSGIPFRRVAVSNGSECATSQPFAAGAVLLSYNGKGRASFWADLAADVVMPAVGLTLNQPAMALGLTLPGNTSMSFEMEVKSKADGSGNQVYKGRVTYTKKVLGLINVTAVLTNRNFSSSSSTLPYDNFPGGYYDVSREFNINSSSMTNDLLKFNATAQQQPHFCFIPAPSALDIGGGNVSLVKADYLTSYVGANPPTAPKNTPFQNFITAFNDGSTNNEEHISILRRNGDWVAAELNNTGQVANCTVFCNPLSITGPSYICTSGLYSVSAVAGATYTWSATPAGSVTFAGAGNSVTVNRGGSFSGAVTITANITFGQCGTTPVRLNILVGNPLPPGYINWTWNLPPNRVRLVTDGSANATSYQWYLNGTLKATTTATQYDLPMSGNVSCGNFYYFGVKAVNGCGTSGETYIGATMPSCDEGLMLSPNPTADNVKIDLSTTNVTTAAKTTSSATAAIREVVVYDKLGAVRLRKKFSQANAVQTVSLSSLPNDVYTLQVFDGQTWRTGKIVVQH